MVSEDIGPFYSGPRAMTAAQKKKLKRRQQKQAEVEKLTAVEGEMTNLGQEEEKALRQQLASEGKTLINIPGDGNCMFRAVEYQLKEARAKGMDLPDYDHVKLRSMMVRYMKAHRDELEVFVLGASDDMGGDGDSFQSYCDKIAKDGEWGGELELRVLADLLFCKIAVYKRDSAPVVYGSDHPGDPLCVVFHEHAYSMGGHYNTTI